MMYFPIKGSALKINKFSKTRNRSDQEANTSSKLLQPPTERISDVHEWSGVSHLVTKTTIFSGNKVHKTHLNYICMFLHWTTICFSQNKTSIKLRIVKFHELKKL